MTDHNARQAGLTPAQVDTIALRCGINVNALRGLTRWQLEDFAAAILAAHSADARNGEGMALTDADIESIFYPSGGADYLQADKSQAARDVLAERQRQISAEGWTPEHDDKFTNGALSLAAGTYALHGPLPTHGNVPLTWPWDHDGWKPSTPRRNLVKAGALVLAEIERLDRAAGDSSDRAEITPTITANSAVNANRAQIVSRAVNAHGQKWPEQLTSGVMFYEGERITRAEFLAEVRA